MLVLIASVGVASASHPMHYVGVHAKGNGEINEYTRVAVDSFMAGREQSYVKGTGLHYNMELGVGVERYGPFYYRDVSVSGHITKLNDYENLADALVHGSSFTGNMYKARYNSYTELTTSYFTKSVSLRTAKHVSGHPYTFNGKFTDYTTINYDDINYYHSFSIKGHFNKVRYYYVDSFPMFI